MELSKPRRYEYCLVFYKFSVIYTNLQDSKFTTKTTNKSTNYSTSIWENENSSKKWWKFKKNDEKLYVFLADIMWSHWLKGLVKDWKESWVRQWSGYEHSYDWSELFWLNIKNGCRNEFRVCYVHSRFNSMASLFSLRHIILWHCWRISFQYDGHCK